MDDHTIQIRTICRLFSRKPLFLLGIFASIILVFYNFTLPYRNVSSSKFSSFKEEEEIFSGEATSLKSKRFGMFSLLRDAQNSSYPKVILDKLDFSEYNNVSEIAKPGFRDEEMNVVSKKELFISNVSGPSDDMNINREILSGFDGGKNLKNVGDQFTWPITQEDTVNQQDIAFIGMSKEVGNEFAFTSLNTTDLILKSNNVLHGDVSVPSNAAPFSNYGPMMDALVDTSSSHVALIPSLVNSSAGIHEIYSNSIELTKGTTFKNNTNLPISSSISSSPAIDSKHANILMRSKPGRLPISVSEMKQIMLTNHSSNLQKSQRHSALDKRLLAAKELLQNVPLVKNDEQLYEPAFWNISIFKRSYELMERILKIYVYKEGNKPVFHQPLLRGIYASEGWLMKLLQSDRHFVVRDYRKAHLFYLPFSSRLLQLALYDRNSHSHRNLAQHLKSYVDLIATKYPYWNRTGGADHFAAACHDWAPHITAQAMGTSIRALCNADLRKGFQLGKDVSLPEIYVRSARNPLRDLGGNSADNRSTLAFYAGNLHGRLRPVLLQYWENKDPNMKILGPMPAGVESKMIYIQHMKNSKYCICPRGYEVNSPRVIESIYYECVPVILSDNYVPPFFEVLNWETFSVIIPEEDVPRLKDVLVSIPEERYRLLQLGVRRVQQHFLWHNKPVKYDLFHMILHSLWHNRLLQIGGFS